MPVIGSASVQIRAIDKFFERDVRTAVRKIKNVEIELKADVDLTKVNKKLRDLRYRMRNNVIQLNIEADTATIEKSFERIVRHYDGRNVTIQGGADTARAEAQLDLVSRNRRSVIDARISPQTQKALKGLFYTITGSIPFDKVKAGLLGLAGNFEGITIKGAAVVSVISALTAELFSATGAAFALGQDLLDVVGIAAALPAGFFMLGTAIAATTISWKGFSDAVSGKGKKGAAALANLPKEAQDAAISLRGVGKAIATPVKEAFWTQVGTSLQSLVKTTLPDLKAGLAGTGKVMGQFTKTSFASLEKFVKSGGLATMFANSNKGLSNMRKGIDPVITALGKLGTVGSKFLPQFGDWLGTLGERFGNFIDRAGEDKISGWITDAVNTFKLLATSVGSVSKLFGAINDAANMAGFGGLKAFSDGLAGAAKVADSEPFKSNLVNFFEAAGDASKVLHTAIGNLFSTLGGASQAFGGFFRAGTGAVAAFIDNISAMFEHSNLLAGLYIAVDSFKSAMQNMEPGFIHLGNIIGNVGVIASAVFTAMAPGFNDIMSTLDQVFAALTPGLSAVIPIFNAFVQSVVSLAGGPIIVVAQAIGDLFTAFSKAPGWIQLVVMSFGALLFMGPKLNAVFGSISKGFNTMRTRIDGDVTGLTTGQARTAKAFGQMRDHVGSMVNAFRTMPFAAATSGIGGIGTAASAAIGSGAKAGLAGLKGAASGLMGIMGGPWGLAIGGATALLGMYGAAQEESKQKTDALSQTLDQQTGHITNATKSLLATNALDGATSGWDDFWRGIYDGAKSTEETLSQLGTSTKEYTDKLADSSSRDSYIKGLEAVRDAMRDGRPITDEMAKSIGTTTEKLKGLDQGDLSHLTDKAKNAAAELSKAEEKTKALAAATGITSARAAVLQKNFETLASATSSANDKFSALKSNLDIISHGSMTAVNTQKGLAQALADTKSGLDGIAAGGKVSLDGLYSIKNGFNFATQAGRDFHTTLEGAADGILKNGTAALDQAIKAGKSTADANAIAIQAMQPGVAALRKQLGDLGVAGPKVDAIIRSFGLMPDQIATAINVNGAEEAQRKIFLTKLAADTFASGNYNATLAALPDAAKAEIERVTGMAGAFKAGKYDAILGALDKTAGGKEAALASILSVTNGNYAAALKALNLTGPQVAAAKQSINGVQGKSVTITAIDGATSTLDFVTRKINGIERYVKVTVDSVYNNRVAPGKGGNAAQGADGGIVRSAGNLSSLLRGKFPLKAFASGGVEKHTAQIAKAGAMRLWAEPETGGEAYIPLAKGKRKRSLKILEEVAKMFGMSLFGGKAFANGGTEGGKKSSSSSSSSVGSATSAFASSIASALLKDNQSLNNIGKNVVSGIIVGVNQNTPQAIEGMKGLSNALEDTVRTELDIHSPSKTFLGLGKHIVDGLTVGIKTTAGAAVKQMATLANRLFVAARDVAKANGRSVQSTLNTLNAQKKASAGWKKLGATKYSDSIIDYYQRTRKTGRATLIDYVAARENVNVRLNAANKRLADLQKARNEIASSVAGSIKGEYKLGTSIIGNTEPYVPKMQFSDVSKYTATTLARLRAFNTKLVGLKKKGVSPTLINEVASLGSSEGSSLADALLQGSATDIKNLNSQVSAIASTATQIGNSTADGMYKAGIDAQKGLVRGLTADSKSATAAINGIADSLVRTFKSRLGIKSPSRVFMQLGKYTTQGYVKGLQQSQPEVTRQIQAMVNPTQGSFNSGTTSTSSSLGSPAAPVQVTINPPAGTDSVAVGKAAVRELNFQLLSTI